MKSSENEAGKWISEVIPEEWEWIPFTDIFTDKTSSKKKLPQKSYQEKGKYIVVDQGQERVGGYSDQAELLYQGPLPIIVFGDHTRCVKYFDSRIIQGADGTKVLCSTDISDSRFAYWALRAIDLPDKGYSRHFKFLKASYFPLPPLNEQRRIVAKIEELTAHSKRARAALDEVPTLIEQFKQSVLAAAFRGDLTAEWREKNPDVEPAEKLLERIAEQNNKKIKIEHPNVELQYEVPESWCWMKVKDIGDVSLGRQRSPKNHTGPYMRPYVRAANITWGGWDLSDVKEMNFDERDFKVFRLHPGDVLINEGSGSAHEVGKPAIWNDEISDCCFQNTLISVRPYAPMSNFLYYVFLNAALSKSFVKETRGVNIHHIGKKGLANFVIPVPPLNEQAEIVRTLDIVLERVEDMTQQQKSSQSFLSTLDQSILARAFRGELVPQDPNDEPASVLLERIRTEREKLEAIKKKKKRSSRKKAK